MNKHKRWTKEEEDILVKAISNNPHNIRKACKEIATKLNRTEGACLYHWYVILSPSSNPTKIGVSFISIGNKSIYKNRKNSGISVSKPNKFNLWIKIKKLLKL